MRLPVYRGVWNVVCLMALSIAGCGGTERPADRPETVPVKGTVTYQGSPVADATVTFVAAASGAASTQTRGAVGRTDASGAFTMTTFDPGDGAIPGSYQVTVVKMENAGPVAENPDPTAPPPPAPKSLVPDKFANPNTSGLTVDVKKEGENNFPLDLGS